MKQIYFQAGLHLLLVGCSDPGAHSDERVPSTSDSELFPADRVLEVELELTTDAWDALRREGRDAADALAGCTDLDFEYNYFKADVSIDGETVTDVDVRKKGYAGSLSLLRPSLKLNFGRKRDDDRTFRGAKRMTLNNNRQDAALLRQCLFYGFLEDVGLPGPRCGFASVRVNGKDLGIYSHVEPIKKPFLKRLFGTDDGKLYEAQVADFSPGRVDRFQEKTLEGSGRGDLERVVRALELPDDELLESLDELFDLDELFSFWAAEVLAGHWDGMAGTQNNYYLYHDTQDDRFHPIAWGADAAFVTRHAFLPSDHPRSVLATGAVHARLYALPEGRRRYHRALRALLDDHWDETSLLAEVERVAKLVEAPRAAVDAVVEFIEGRRAVTEKELAQNDGTGPDYPYPPPVDPVTCRPPTETRGDFELVWSEDQSTAAYAPLPESALSYELSLFGQPLEFEPASLLGAAQVEASPNDGHATAVRLTFYGPDTLGRTIALQFVVPGELYKVGTIPFHGFETRGSIVDLSDGTDAFRLLGMVGAGALTLETAPTSTGEPVIGHWEGRVADVGAGQSAGDGE